MGRQKLLYRAVLFGILILLMLNPVMARIYAQGEAPQQNRISPVVRFKHITSDDGLVQNNVEAIMQDSRGFMWFGTPTGLSRYDGYQFTTYRNDPDNPNSLSQNYVRGLYEDKDGMIWIGTEGGGVNRFDPHTETFTRFMPDPQNQNTLAGDRIFAVYLDSKGNYWFGGLPPTDLTRFDPRTQTFTQFSTDAVPPDQAAQLPNGRVTRIMETDDRTLWVVSDDALVKIALNTDQFTAYHPANARDVRLSRMVVDADGQLWIGSNKGLFRLDATSGALVSAANISGITDLTTDDAGTIWIAAMSGVWRFDPKTASVLDHYIHDANFADSLSSNTAYSVYKDKAGLIWVGTDAGLNIYDPRQTQFTFYRHDAKSPASLSEGVVSSVYTSGNDLWVGVGTTLNRINLANGQVKQYTSDLLNAAPISIASIYQDRSGIIWLGSSNFSLFSFDPSTETFTAHPLKHLVQAPLNSPPSAIVAFAEDSQGALWFPASHEGLYRLDPQREALSFVELNRGPLPSGTESGNSAAGGAPDNRPSGSSSNGGLQGGGPNGPAGNNSPPNGGSQGGPPNGAGGPRNNPRPKPPLTNLYVDSYGIFWITSWNGVLRFDPATQKSEAIRTRAGNTGPDVWVDAMLIDKGGVLWLATREGLIRQDLKTKQVKFYTEKDGLPSPAVVGIFDDNDGNLWLSTLKGISRFTPATGTFHNYDVANGLQGNEFKPQVATKTADGRIIFGGLNGLTAFYPQNITDNTYHPNVVLTGFELFNKPVIPGKESLLKSPIWDTGDLTLNHDQNIVSFEFAALGYAAPQKNHYRYKLDGFETNWNETDSSRRFATYTNLPAGDYVFRVQGTNSDGLWSDREASLHLTVLPPWWETNWFRGLLVAGIVTLLVSGYRWRVYRIEHRNRVLESLVDERTHDLQQRTEELQTREEQLRLARDAAEAANRAKSAFLANMSHELRTPLNVILGFAQVTNREQNAPQEVRENLNIIQRSGEHLLTLINQVLDLSKIEAGHMGLNESDFDFHQMLSDIEDMFILKAEDKNLRLLFERSGDLPRYLRADDLKLRQTLINLLSNALKFTDDGGVTVRVRQLAASDKASSACKLHFEIEDTGPGIPPEDLATLFEAFTQTETGRNAQEGTGLGLSITHKFIRLMGGELTVQSRVGQGTIFSFNIDCQILEEAPRITSQIKQRVISLREGQPRYRILLVDDKWANRQLLVKLLGPLGFDLREAENGKEAIEVALIFKPHLILMDMRMPIIDGYEATRQIKASAIGKSVIVIALTASAFDEERAAVLAAGCDDFLRKPFRTDRIFEILGDYLDVKYVFASDDTTPAIQPAGDQIAPDILKAQIAVQPAGLIKRLIDGIELGDTAIINTAITEIRQTNSTLADALTRQAQRFEYSKLLSLLQEIG